MALHYFRKSKTKKNRKISASKNYKWKKKKTYSPKGWQSMKWFAVLVFDMCCWIDTVMREMEKRCEKDCMIAIGFTQFAIHICDPFYPFTLPGRLIVIAPETLYISDSHWFVFRKYIWHSRIFSIVSIEWQPNKLDSNFNNIPKCHIRIE